MTAPLFQSGVIISVSKQFQPFLEIIHFDGKPIKMIKILYYLKICKEFFFSKLFVLFIKISVSTKFQAISGNLNFWQKINSCRPDRNDKKFVLSEILLRFLFCNIICSTNQNKYCTQF